MPVLAHPGPDAPPAPAVRLEVPDAWAARPAGDGLLRAGGAGAQGDDVDVLVRHVTTAPGTGAEAFVEGAAAGVRGEAEVEEPFVVEIAGREWHARNVSWEEAGAPVVEVHLASALEPTGAVGRLVHVVGRVRGAGLDQDYDAVQSVLETLAVEEAGA